MHMHMAICLFPGNSPIILEVFFILWATYRTFIILGIIPQAYTQMKISNKTLVYHANVNAMREQ